MRQVLIFIFLLTIPTFLTAQSCNVLSDNYFSSGLWTYINHSTSSHLAITNGAFTYVSCSDGSEERMHRSLNTTLTNQDTWEAEIDFFPISGGNVNASGHIPLALTAGNLEPLANCQNPASCGPNHNWSKQNQDGIIVFFGTLIPPGTQDPNTFFQLHVKDGMREWNSRVASQQLIFAPLNKLYHIKLTVCPDKIQLFVSQNGTNLPGSPIVYNIPANTVITGFNTVQHGNSARGVSTRKLTAALDNLCIRKLSNQNPVLSGVNGSTSLFSESIYACEGMKCFKIYSSDPDQNQILSIKLNSVLPSGAVITWSNAPFPVVEFCWDPDDTQIGTYQVQLTVTDDQCTPGSGTYTYQIDVIDGYNLGGPISLCQSDAPLALADPGPGMWYLGSGGIMPVLANGIFDPSQYAPGIYNLSYCTPKTGGNANCTGCWPLKITLNYSPVISWPVFPAIICKNDPPFQVQASPPGGTFSGGPYITQGGMFSPQLAATSPPGTNPVTYTVQAQGGCTDVKTINIQVYSVETELSVDLGKHCNEEFIFFGQNATLTELIDIRHPVTFQQPVNAPAFPVVLQGSLFHPSYINQFGNAPIGYLYFFRVHYKNANGCDYSMEFVYELVECYCWDQMIQSASISVVPLSGNLYFGFSISPGFQNFSGLERYRWTISDIYGIPIKVLDEWDASSGTNPSSSFSFDFTPYYGSLLTCGWYKIYLQVVITDNEENKGFCQKTLPIYICDEQSNSGIIDENMGTSSLLGVSVHPNPARDRVSLELDPDRDRLLNCELYDLNGRLIDHLKTPAKAGEKSQVTINLENLNDGMYLLHLYDEEISTVKYIFIRN